MKTQTPETRHYYSKDDDITFQPLTPEREQELMTAWQQNDDLAARDELIRCHLKFAAKQALLLGRPHLHEEDAIAAGNLAIMKALSAKKFQSKGARFSTYLRSFIMGAIRVARRDTFRSTGIPASHWYPEASPVAIPNPGAGPNCITLVLMPDVEEHDLQERRRELLLPALQKLSSIEQTVITDVYFRNKSYAETGRDRGGLTREGVRKIHDRAIKKLRAMPVTEELV